MPFSELREPSFFQSSGRFVNGIYERDGLPGLKPSGRPHSAGKSMSPAEGAGGVNYDWGSGDDGGWHTVDRSVSVNHHGGYCRESAGNYHGRAAPSVVIGGGRRSRPDKRKVGNRQQALGHRMLRNVSRIGTPLEPTTTRKREARPPQNQPLSFSYACV